MVSDLILEVFICKVENFSFFSIFDSFLQIWNDFRLNFTLEINLFLFKIFLEDVMIPKNEPKLSFCLNFGLVF